MGACGGKEKVSREHAPNCHEFLASIDAYETIPLIPLEQAVKPLVPLLPAVQNYVQIVKRKCQNPSDGLTQDESASIMLYSMGWQPLDKCLYVVLNRILQSTDRQKLKPWFPYLKLLLTAFSRLPSTHLTVYRGIKLDLSEKFQTGTTIVWWDFSLCMNTIESLQVDDVLGNTGERTIFIIECDSGKDIRQHSYFASQDLVLLLPATQFKVVECVDQHDGLHLIRLQETRPPFFHLQLASIISGLSPHLAHVDSAYSTNPTQLIEPTPTVTRNLRKIWTSLTSLTTTQPASTTDRLIENADDDYLALKQYINECECCWAVDLNGRKLNNRCLEIVAQHAIINKHCKRLKLRDNGIKPQGASILADALYNNTTLQTLDLRNNSVSDMGTRSLALSISNSTLRSLNLESNGITEKGAQYLAEMLKTNRSLAELYLSKNQIGDRGVELLANVLKGDKMTIEKNSNKQEFVANLFNLQQLYLGQNGITDIGIRHLAEMLKTNRTLTWLWLSNNEIGNRGVELLSNVLAHHNTTLVWLFLSSNKSITDSSVDSLIDMLKRNYSLKTIYIDNCNLSEAGQAKLREVTKSNNEFELEV